MSRGGENVAWGGVEAFYTEEELETARAMREAGESKDVLWFIHVCKAELDARLVSETGPDHTAASVARPASSSAEKLPRMLAIGNGPGPKNVLVEMPDGSKTVVPYAVWKYKLSRGILPQNDERAPTRRGGRWRPIDGQVSLL